MQRSTYKVLFILIALVLFIFNGVMWIPATIKQAQVIQALPVFQLPVVAAVGAIAAIVLLLAAIKMPLGEEALQKPQEEQSSAKKPMMSALLEQEQAITPPALQTKETSGATHPGAEAVQLLSMLQTKGRFMDFVMEDITTFEDAQVGAAARMVHQGCKEILDECFNIQPIYNKEEGSDIVVESGFSTRQFRFVGNVDGEPPFKGVLLHRGWKTLLVNLPKSQSPQDPAPVIAPAEVEIKQS